MSIDFEEFNQLESSNAKNKILDFLKKEKAKAFEYKELAKLVNESERTVNAYLSLLKSEGKVLHKQPYWAYNPDYSEESGNDLKEINENKVVPSTFRYEGDGIFSYNKDSSIKLNLNGSIKLVERELTKRGLCSQNIGGFYYLLRKRAGLLNKRSGLPKSDDEIIRRGSEMAIDETAEGFGEGLPTNYGQKRHRMISQIRDVANYMNKGHTFQTAVKRISGDYDVHESTIRDACTGRLGIKTREFISLVETNELDQFLKKKSYLY